MNISQFKSLKFPAHNFLHWLNLENIIWALFLTIIFILTFECLLSPIACFIFSVPALSFIKNIELEKIFSYIATVTVGIFMAILCFYLIKFFDFILNKVIKFPVKLSAIRIILLIFSFVMFYGMGWLSGVLFVGMYDDHPGQNDEAAEQRWYDEESRTGANWSITWGLTSMGVLLLIFKLRDKRKKKL